MMYYQKCFPASEMGIALSITKPLAACVNVTCSRGDLKIKCPALQ